MSTHIMLEAFIDCCWKAEPGKRRVAGGCVFGSVTNADQEARRGLPLPSPTPTRSLILSRRRKQYQHQQLKFPSPSSPFAIMSTPKNRSSRATVAPSSPAAANSAPSSPTTPPPNRCRKAQLRHPLRRTSTERRTSIHMQADKLTRPRRQPQRFVRVCALGKKKLGTAKS